MSTLINGKIARITGSPTTSIIVNKGALDGVTRNSSFVAYIPDGAGALTDPNPPGSVLGVPRLITCIGTALFVQDHMTTVVGTFSQMATVATQQDVEITIP